jgi:hypothetical protein
MKNKILDRMPLERVTKAREFFTSPWNANKAFVIMWGMGDGSNTENNKSQGAQNKISFSNTEKSQIDAIAKILNMEDRIKLYRPINPKHKLRYTLTWSDQLLSDYLHSTGFRVKKTDVGAHFPSNFPNHLMDIGAYGFWLANGGIAVQKMIPKIYFFGCEEFLRNFQRELEAYIGFPGNIGILNKGKETSEGKVNLWGLLYNGKQSFRVLSAMFKRTGEICYSGKRDKTTNILSNYVNTVLDKRDKAKKPKAPYTVKKIVALYDASGLIDAETRERYLEYVGHWIHKIRSRAQENWYLKEA